MKRKILSYSTFLAETKSHPILNEGVDYSAVSSSELQSIIDIDMRKYLKTAMWNKSIEVFYGKDYKGNPAEDKGELYVGDWSYKGHDKTTMGEFFMDAWAETDQFCDRVVELVEKGEISDMWNTIGRGAKWAAIGVAIAGAVVATGGMALGALGVVGAAGTALTAGAAVSSGVGITAMTCFGIAGVGYHIDTVLDEEKLKKLSPETINLISMVKDKESTIKNFKSVLEKHTDFEADWGLDRWLPGIQGMPGWSKSNWAKSGAENIGYSFLYWIANFAYHFLITKVGASVVLAAKEQDATKGSSTNTWTPNQTTTTTQTTTQPSSTTTAQPDSTSTTAPVGGVMGTVQPKQYNFIVDDSTLKIYDL